MGHLHTSEMGGHLHTIVARVPPRTTGTSTGEGPLGHHGEASVTPVSSVPVPLALAPRGEGTPGTHEGTQGRGASNPTESAGGMVQTLAGEEGTTTTENPHPDGMSEESAALRPAAPTTTSTEALPGTRDGGGGILKGLHGVGGGTGAMMGLIGDVRDVMAGLTGSARIDVNMIVVGKKTLSFLVLVVVLTRGKFRMRASCASVRSPRV